MSTTLAERASSFLGTHLSRRSFINRSAVIGSAVAVGSGVDLLLRPGSAYAAVCTCADTSCGCGTTCCAGFSEFCCSINDGYNYCPSGTVMGGWWKADNSTYCDGPRYYMDCHATCGCDTGCGGGWGFCDPGCDGADCACGPDGCDSWVTGCFQFRYGQCNQQIDCIGRIVCRVVACVPPWTIDPTCTTTLAEDDSTAEMDRGLLDRGTTGTTAVAVLAPHAVHGAGHGPERRRCRLRHGHIVRRTAGVRRLRDVR